MYCVEREPILKVIVGFLVAYFLTLGKIQAMRQISTVMEDVYYLFMCDLPCLMASKLLLFGTLLISEMSVVPGSLLSMLNLLIASLNAFSNLSASPASKIPPVEK